MKIVLMAGLAGFVGTLARFGTERWINHALPGFPWGTLAVNMTGSFLAGFLFILCREKFQAHEAYFPMIFIGFLGAFTTFSTFALESARYLFNEQYAKFFLNVSLQNVTGICTACLGLLLARFLFVQPTP